VSPEEAYLKLEPLFCHVWMVRTFLRHSEEAEDDDDLSDVHRTLYDVMHALGAPSLDGDAAGYLKACKKKLGKLRAANELFQEIQPEISSHTNFRMAAQSLAAAVQQIEAVVAQATA
jgi:hypothetical protein